MVAEVQVQEVSVVALVSVEVSSVMVTLVAAEAGLQVLAEVLA